MQTSIDLLSYFIEHGTSRDLYEAVIKRVNKYLTGHAPPSQHYHSAKKALHRICPIQPRGYDICPKTHCLFVADNDDEYPMCQVCKSLRFIAPGEASRTMKQLSLKDRIALLVTKKKIPANFCDISRHEKRLPQWSFTITTMPRPISYCRKNSFKVQKCISQLASSAMTLQRIGAANTAP